MARLRYNGLTATLGADLTATDTTITFAAALTHAAGTVPTIASGDYIPFSLLDSNGEVVELVNLTAYTAGDLAGTIARAQEGTTAATHVGGAVVAHAPTILDFASSGSGGSAGSGTLRGDWTSGNTYAANDMVFQKGVLWAARNAATDAPQTGDIPSTSVASTGWSANSCAVVDGTVPEVALLNNAVNDYASLISLDTFTGWSGVTISADLYMAGAADELQFCIMDAAQSATSLTTSGLLTVTGVYGVRFDIYNNAVQVIANGTGGAQVTHTPDTTAYETFQLVLSSDATNMTIVVKRGTTTITTFTIAKPTFTNYRLAFGSRSGSQTGVFKVRGTPNLGGTRSANWRRIAKMIDAS